ncbi:uncharacterized protein LOC107793769 isoform X2 [Nicotiana tabacum]|uniref:Uncharacterized protein LOC107793769 isoform X2 n=1 Tax=Nicotiana tabacum TaxID=4097 RepID=A0A1S4A4U5_TOBAC|nr:PREDICTED: uncharacterized protein LOC107793769 isoform X2 [Nicotiana tabacum]
MILQTTTHSFTFSSQPISRNNLFFKNLTFFTSPLLPKSFLPNLDYKFYFGNKRNSLSVASGRTKTTIDATLLEAPVIWADLEADGNADLGFAKWFEELQSKPEKEASDRRKLVSKWHPTTKGTLRRNYRIPSKPEGRRLLKAIASLLSDDDHFRDATSHKGCQIRRESAHGESVCCNNVRALFDELPTPHLTVEITPFPAGPLTENDYAKAEKLERVLRSGPSV